MTRTTHRILSALLVLVLAVSLAVPALAVETVKVTDVALDKTLVTLAPGETVTLVPVITPANATNQKVSWKTNKSAVATVKDGVVTAKAPGTADITVTTSDGGYSAVCKVTVESNYVTDLTLTPAGPEILPVGKTRQLKAKVSFAHSPAGSQEVTWSSNAPEVASVSPQGLVTALAAGEAEIMAMTKENGRSGTPIYQTYKLTVSDGQSGDNSNDRIFLGKTREELPGGLYQTITLPSPGASVVRNETDVSSDYTFAWSWTNDKGEVISTDKTASLSLVTSEEISVVCTVTATSRTDSTKEPLAASCVYVIDVMPSTLLTASLDVNAGATTLDKLTDPDKSLTVMDQLTKGSGTTLTPVIEGLTELKFFPDEATGEAGALNVSGDQAYGVTDAAAQKLSAVVFTPVTAGTYIIPFLAYGAETYYGQLEVVVTGELDPAFSGDASITCTSSGVTFAGSDFYDSTAADPAASVTFGKPSAGQLLRNMAYGSGTPDTGAKYYTDSAKDGDYHVSTLSYLPPAGFSGKVSVPITVTARSGQKTDGYFLIEVKGKTASAVFTDVTAAATGSWSANSVDFAYDNHLINGTGDKVFSPDATMTRAMLVTVLYRAAGSPAVAVNTAFTDLDTKGYYYNAVVWANAMGVVSGTSDKTFSPNDPVTREQIAVILYRYASLTGHAGDSQAASLDRFADRRLVSSYATRGLGWAVGRGIVTGTSATTLSPEAPATRAQVVVMLHRYLAS